MPAGKHKLNNSLIYRLEEDPALSGNSVFSPQLFERIHPYILEWSNGE